MKHIKHLGLGDYVFNNIIEIKIINGDDFFNKKITQKIEQFDVQVINQDDRTKLCGELHKLRLVISFIREQIV